jgi:hypothetical protein
VKHRHLKITGVIHLNGEEHEKFPITNNLTNSMLSSLTIFTGCLLIYLHTITVRDAYSIRK